MRKYLSTIHEKSHSHRKRFAFLTSAGFTLMIFGIWALVNFGSTPLTTGGTAASANKAEPNPFGSLLRGIGSGFDALIGGADDLKDALEVVDVEGGYQEMKQRTLDNYGGR